MKSRVPSPDPPKSLADTLEYGLTILLVIIVITAVLDIFGVHIGAHR